MIVNHQLQVTIGLLPQIRKDTMYDSSLLQ
jgi:hypothetical protein